MNLDELDLEELKVLKREIVLRIDRLEQDDGLTRVKGYIPEIILTPLNEVPVEGQQVKLPPEFVKWVTNMFGGSPTKECEVTQVFEDINHKVQKVQFRCLWGKRRGVLSKFTVKDFQKIFRICKDKQEEKEKKVREKKKESTSMNQQLMQDYFSKLGI